MIMAVRWNKKGDLLLSGGAGARQLGGRGQGLQRWCWWPT